MPVQVMVVGGVDINEMAFLLSPPDEFGYMEDPQFQIALATYLGQSCPVLAPVVGQYFGKKGVVLDQYGTNLASAALPG